eukprot:gene11108-19978_t
MTNDTQSGAKVFGENYQIILDNEIWLPPVEEMKKVAKTPKCPTMAKEREESMLEIELLLGNLFEKQNKSLEVATTMKIRLPIEEMVSDFVKKLIEKQAETSAKAEENTKGPQEKQNKNHRALKLAAGKQEIKFSFGQKALLFNARKSMRKGDKLAQNWSGPYTITEMVGKKHAYLDGKKIKRNIKHLKPWYFYEVKSDEGMEKPGDERKKEVFTDMTVYSREEIAQLPVPERSKDLLKTVAKEKYDVHRDSSKTTSNAFSPDQINGGEFAADLQQSQAKEVYEVRESSAFVTISNHVVILEDKMDNAIPSSLPFKPIPSVQDIVDSLWETGAVGYYELVINGVLISDKRIMELKGETYLSDEVIDAYLAILSRV